MFESNKLNMIEENPVLMMCILVAMLTPPLVYCITALYVAVTNKFFINRRFVKTVEVDLIV